MKGLTEMDKRKIEEKVKNVLSQYIENHNAPIDVIALAKKMGFVVANAMLTNTTDGFIIVNENDANIMNMNTSKIIAVNSNRPLNFKRFIIAHEIGHYILEENSKSILARRESSHGRPEDENDMDYFSACLLMPAELFKREFESLKSSQLSTEDIAIQLSEKFVVPLDSVNRRFDELDLRN